MRLLNLLHEAVTAYHGSNRAAVVFDPTHLGDNSHTFGNYQAKRTGVFFSDNPDFSAMYGQTRSYTLNIHQTATDLLELAFRAAGDLDAHNPDERPLWIDLIDISRGHESWPLFEEDVGDYFVPWLTAQGYDSAQFEEYNEDDNGTEHRSLTTVVFDPSLIVPNTNEGRLLEMPSFNQSYSRKPSIPVRVEWPGSAKKIASDQRVDIYWSAADMTAYVVPTGRDVEQNVGYLSAYTYDRMASHHKGLNYPTPLMVSDVFIDPQHRGGIGAVLYKAIMDQGYTMVSATSLTSDSIGVWRTLITDPAVAVWAMDKQDTKVYPVIANSNGRIEPQGIGFEQAILFASTAIDPVNQSLSESMERINPAVLTKVILATRQEYLDNGNVKCITDIGDGHCENFVSDVHENLGEYGYDMPQDYKELGELDTANFWNDDFHMDLDLVRKHWGSVPDDIDQAVLSDALGSATHVWIYYQGKHYDAEAPRGVDEFLQLPFFQRHIDAVRENNHMVQHWKTPVKEAEAYPPTLSAGDAYSHIYDLHTRDQDWDEGDLSDRIYSADLYKLVWMDPKAIDAEQYALWGDEDEYTDMIRGGSPIPPIFVHDDDGYFTMVDGTHRHVAALRAGVDKIPVYVGVANDDLTESFFADNLDILMPVVRGLMKTAARPLIYKLWKKSPNSVLALAAIKRMHDKGEPDPITKLVQLSNLDVPAQFLRRLAWDAGLYDIAGVRKGHKPGLLPVFATESEPDTRLVYHATLADNLPSIKRNGLEPRIGANSQAIGETEPAVYVFFDWESMEDAVGNWEMDWHEDEDAELVALTLEVPADWLSSRWNNRTSGEGMITQHIPPSMIKSVKRNF